MKRRALGKGIEAIISNRPSSLTKESGYIEIDVDAINPNPYQPRKKFSPEKIAELANSLKESGLIQPIVVWKDAEKNKYYLMVGERRWRAAQQLKWKKIPAIIGEKSKNEVLIGALVENLQREDLNAIEIAEGIELLIDEMGITQEQASEKMSMSRSAITNYLRLLKLPEAVKQYIMSGKLSPGHARTILALEKKDDILLALSKILKGNLSVRQTEKMVKNFHKTKISPHISQDPDMRRMEEKLSKSLSTKVKVFYTKKGNGKIEVHFTQLEEFERIYKILFKE